MSRPAKTFRDMSRNPGNRPAMLWTIFVVLGIVALALIVLGRR
jgi:hypothetical protein